MFRLNWFDCLKKPYLRCFFVFVVLNIVLSCFIFMDISMHSMLYILHFDGLYMGYYRYIYNIYINYRIYIKIGSLLLSCRMYVFVSILSQFVAGYPSYFKDDDDSSSSSSLNT